MKKTASLTAIIVCALALAAAPAMAKNDKHGKHDHRGHHDEDTIIVIQPQDRLVINNYIVADHRKKCPPGLAKKNIGCLPPGHAKKWQRGEVLPDYVVWHPLPQPVLVKMRPAPIGTQYVQVDRDVYLISEASHKIIDAVTLLSAVD